MPSDQTFHCFRCGRIYSSWFNYCSVCLNTGTIVPTARRQPTKLDMMAEISSAAEMAKTSMDLVENCYSPSFKLCRNAMVVLGGEAGAGKSSMGVRLVDSIGGPALMLSCEMGLSPALAQTLRRAKIRRKDFHIVKSGGFSWMYDFIVREKVQALLIDSIQTCHIDSDEARKLLNITPLKLLVGVSQLSRTGQPFRAREWEFESDVNVHVESGKWEIYKSRYQRAPVKGDAFEQEEQEEIVEVSDVA